MGINIFLVAFGLQLKPGYFRMSKILYYFNLTSKQKVLVKSKENLHINRFYSCIFYIQQVVRNYRQAKIWILIYKDL